MIRKAIMLGLILSYMTAATMAMAQDVLVTANGTKYHTEECRWIKNRETMALEKDEAVEEGYGPCKRCYKEDVVVENEEEGETKSSKKSTKKAAAKTKKNE